MKKNYVNPTMRSKVMDSMAIMSVSFEIDHGEVIDNSDDIKANASPIF